MRWFLLLTTVSSVACQELYRSYNVSSIELSGAGFCPSTQKLREKIKLDADIFLNSSVLPKLFAARGSCGCGGPGWRRVAHLNMSDPTQTCPQTWELITTPRRSCARPSNATIRSCYSAMFQTLDTQYSQVCGRIIGYQFGPPGAFEFSSSELSIDGYYVDGVSLTYGDPRQHIWTFANALDEYPHSNYYNLKCPCTNTTEQRNISIPSFVGNDYFCETGVPTGQQANPISAFYPDDPLWDGQGCGPTSTCCTFNNPPWFCKQLPRLTNADLEVRLCSFGSSFVANTPVELVEIYIR